MSTTEATTNGTAKDLLPVTLLCGFLGAGKTTLLKHILETKHADADEDFKCAVIVNDMASLNIDKSLIDQSALVQTDEVIAMQNGCFCCDLQSDLVEQIKELCAKNMFNYMLIEASGVSEPSHIAPLFDLCDDEHDHESEHKEGPQLGEMARLDTCVTVVDAAEFHNNLDSMKHFDNGEMQGTIAELMMDQVEYSNVIILNKQDLVSEAQQQDILDRLAVLQPKAKIVPSTKGKIDVMDILNTHRFVRTELAENSVMLAATRVDEPKEESEPSCCVKSVEEGGKMCCMKKKKNEKLIDTGLSKVLLGVVPANPLQKQEITRHEKRFGITSFVYRSRRPFHPGRLHDLIMNPFFVSSEEKGTDVEVRQQQAAVKRTARTEAMGDLLRSKGFIWVASTHWVMGGWQQAGTMLRVAAEGPWLCETPSQWEGSTLEAQVRKDMTQDNGELYPHGDRRQELVFIGVGLKHQEIQSTLDKCLLTDEEMKQHPLKWEQSMAHLDRIRMTLKEDLNLVPGQSLEEYWSVTLSDELDVFTWFPPEQRDEDEDEEPKPKKPEGDEDGEDGDDDEEEEERPPRGEVEHHLRLTQVCLGRKPKEGERNLVEVTVKGDGRKITTAIAALRTGPVEMQHLDLVFGEPVQFRLAEGTGPVCLSGVQVSEMMEVEEQEGGDEQGEEEQVEGWEDWEEEDMEEEKPLKKLSKKQKQGLKRKMGEEMEAQRAVNESQKKKKKGMQQQEEQKTGHDHPHPHQQQKKKKKGKGPGAK